MNKHLITCILLVPLVCSCGKQATTSVDTREPLLLNDSLQEIITLDTVRDTPLTNELLLNGRVSSIRSEWPMCIRCLVEMSPPFMRKLAIT